MTKGGVRPFLIYPKESFVIMASSAERNRGACHYYGKKDEIVILLLDSPTVTTD
jgi:hypothetical protein